MRTRSVLTTVASVLLASTVFAAAQGTQKQGPGGEGSPAPAQTQQHEGQQGKQAPQKGERRENGSQKQVQEREGSSKQQQGKQETQKQQQGKQETQKEQRGEPKGKGERNDAAQKNERNDAQRGERTDGQRGEPKTLTVEQKTKVRETVLRGGNAPRVTSVNFNVSVGTVVPTTVRVVQVPPVLIEYYPDWRGYFYFVYNDEIIVVDRNHRIIAVLEI